MPQISLAEATDSGRDVTARTIKSWRSKQIESDIRACQNQSHASHSICGISGGPKLCQSQDVISLNPAAEPHWQPAVRFGRHRWRMRSLLSGICASMYSAMAACAYPAVLFLDQCRRTNWDQF